jgi:hypothetical protein
MPCSSLQLTRKGFHGLDRTLHIFTVSVQEQRRCFPSTPHQRPPPDFVTSSLPSISWSSRAGVYTTSYHRLAFGVGALLGILRQRISLRRSGTKPSPIHHHQNRNSNNYQSSRWAIWTALDILTELLLLILPLHMTWNLQMPTSRKLAVLSAFYLRLPIIGISIGRLVYTQKLCNKPSDLGLSTALVLIWICVQASYALLASNFLALRALTLSFNSGFGFGFTLNAGPESYSMHQRSRAGLKSKSGGDSHTAGSTGLVLSKAVLDSHSSSRELSNLSIMRETEYSVQYQDVTDEAPILSRA